MRLHVALSLESLLTDITLEFTLVRTSLNRARISLTREHMPLRVFFTSMCAITELTSIGLRTSCRVMLIHVLLESAFASVVLGAVGALGALHS